MKVFEFQVNGEKEWVTAKNVLQAVIFYCNETSISLTDFQPEDDVVEVPESKWEEMVIYHDEDMTEEETFADAVKRLNGRADILATTHS